MFSQDFPCFLEAAVSEGIGWITKIARWNTDTTKLANVYVKTIIQHASYRGKKENISK